MPSARTSPPNAQLLAQLAALGDAQLAAWASSRPQLFDTELQCQCYSLLRGRESQTALLAAALIIFDLARQGHLGAQREFEQLAYRVLDLGTQRQSVAIQVATTPHFLWLWPLCEQALDELDPRLSGESVKRTETAALRLEELQAATLSQPEIKRAATVALELDIIDESDITEELAPHNQDGLDPRLLEVLGSYFDFEPDLFGRTGELGFFAKSRRDVERCESFLLRMQELDASVPGRQAMLALTELFLGSQLKLKNLWGRPNRRRMELVASGLRRLVASDASVLDMGAYFGWRDSDPEAWAKVASLILDFLHWAPDAEGQRGRPLADRALPYAERVRAVKTG